MRSVNRQSSQPEANDQAIMPFAKQALSLRGGPFFLGRLSNPESYALRSRLLRSARNDHVTGSVIAKDICPKDDAKAWTGCSAVSVKSAPLAVIVAELRGAQLPCCGVDRATRASEACAVIVHERCRTLNSRFVHAASLIGYDLGKD